MNKLRSHTIVPSDLYVRRKADDQLAQIIDDMGRPGYVLVARQMGKTNLLLNAKRAANPNDLFVYLDVSNGFPDLQSFLRNIVDISLEGLREKGVFLAEKIQLERISDDLLSHKEHERELRRILQTIEGKLIICLDEIDALIKTSYSDQIFSFIRSIYFSGRANIQEFQRLTYILSGVAEPTVLIRNRSISPFNIGEKIYLEDFSQNEFNQFLLHAGIDFNQEVKDRIYYWTNGHPRMTWDVVSTVEKLETHQTEKEVDEAVKELYFANIDIPPVDHIKNIVEDSKEIRDAIVAIHYDKTGSIPESTRTKLYLAGVSRFDVKNRQVSFKNKIIEISLSEEFLQNVDALQSSYEIGTKYFNLKAYSEALGAFVEFIKNQPTDPKFRLAQYYAGISCFYLKKYKEVITYFNAPETSLPLKSLVAQYYFEGLSHLALNDYEMAIELLQRAVLAGPLSSDFPTNYYEAKVELANAFLLSKSSLAQYADAYLIAFNYSKELIDNQQEMRVFFENEIDFKKIIFRAYLNLAIASKYAEKKDDALKFISYASLNADYYEKLKLLLVEHSLVSSKIENDTILTNLAQVVLEIRVFDDEAAPGQTSVLADVVELFGRLQKRGFPDLLISVIDHVASHLAAEVDVYDFVSELVSELFNAGKHELARRVVDRALKIQHTRGSSDRRRNLLALAVIINVAEADRYGPNYLATFEDEAKDVIDIDLRFLLEVATAALNRTNIALASRARDLVLCFKVKENDVADLTQSESHAELIQEYLDLLVKLRIGANPAVVAQAAAFIRRLALVKNFSLTYFPETFHKTMQSELLGRMRGGLTPVPFKRDRKKYGRNDLVTVEYDGIRKHGKHKNFAADLLRGVCVIITEASVRTGLGNKDQ